jgi:DNA-binding CsgD family transcriptional regulator
MVAGSSQSLRRRVRRRVRKRREEDAARTGKASSAVGVDRADRARPSDGSGAGACDGVADASKSQNGKGGWVLVNPALLVGCLGVVSCFAWLFVVLGSPESTYFNVDGTFDLPLGPVSFIAGTIISLLFTWWFATQFNKNHWIAYSLGVVFTIAGLVGMMFAPSSSPALLACSALTGAGFGFSYVQCGSFICDCFSDYIRTYVVAILLAASILCMPVPLFSEEVRPLFEWLFPLIVFVAGAFETRYLVKEGFRPIEKHESDARARISWRSYYNTAASGLVTGFSLGAINVLLPTIDYLHLAILGLVAAVCAVLLYDSMHGNKINETVTMRLFLPVSAVLVFPMMFVPNPAKIVFAALALAFSFLPLASSISAIMRHIVIYRLSPSRAYSFGRLMSFIGIGAGIFFGSIAFSSSFRAAYGIGAAYAVVAVFMLIEIFSVSFVMTEDNYPYDEQASSHEEEATGSGRDAQTEAVSDRHGGHERNRIGRFTRQCDAVAEKYGLSKRQREVLEMLAKGRNAEYITEKLVISQHTAKAHIYNIYQKTGVHSRQELMDLVEGTDVSNDGSDWGTSR